MIPAINAAFDRLVRVDFTFGSHRRSTFQSCGIVGLSLAFVMAQVLIAKADRSFLMMTGLSLSAVGTFLLLAMVTKLLSGEENLIYYHHEIAIVVTSALVLWVLKQPILGYLDITILGVGLFLACGRVGCFLVGCCHGRPCRFGVRYRDEHVQAGFTRHYAGIRLFPVQVIESLWVFLLVIVGAVMVWTGKTPGTAFAWYVVMYDAGRYCLEFGRGDPDRPDHIGFSTAQWLSIVLTWLVVIAGWLDWLPAQRWHLLAAIALTITTIVILVLRRFRSNRWRVRHPHHVREIAGALERLPTLPPQTVITTSAGILLSAGTAQGTSHVTVSSRTGDAALASVAARIVAGLVAQQGAVEMVPGTHGVTHVVVVGLASGSS